MSSYTKPLPPKDEDHAPFWQGALRREVVMQRCSACGTYRFPASRYCASCCSDASAWMPVSGRGVIESYCLFHQVYFESFAADVPYNVALVRLDEGPRLFTNIVGVRNEDLRIGAAVVAVFEQVTPQVALIKFGLSKGAP